MQRAIIIFKCKLAEIRTPFFLIFFHFPLLDINFWLQNFPASSTRREAKYTQGGIDFPISGVGNSKEKDRPWKSREEKQDWRAPPSFFNIFRRTLCRSFTTQLDFFLHVVAQEKLSDFRLPSFNTHSIYESMIINLQLKRCMRKINKIAKSTYFKDKRDLLMLFPAAKWEYKMDLPNVLPMY